jgi:3-dehydrosphinganine reductase
MSAETKAIAGNVKTLAPTVAADARIAGMTRPDFETFPHLGSRLVARAQGLLPGLARRVCDSARRSAAARM